MQDFKAGIVKKLTSGVRNLIKSNGGAALEGRGKLIDPRTPEWAQIVARL